MNYMDDMFAHMQTAPPLDEDGIARAGLPLREEEYPIITRDALIAGMKTVYDPEIPVDIYELGLIYNFEIADNGNVSILMTLTAPGCPVAGVLPGHLGVTVAELDGVGEVEVQLTWDPIWGPELMSEAARVELNMF